MRSAAGYLFHAALVLRGSPPSKNPNNCGRCHPQYSEDPVGSFLQRWWNFGTSHRSEPLGWTTLPDVPDKLNIFARPEVIAPCISRTQTNIGGRHSLLLIVVPRSAFTRETNRLRRNCNILQCNAISCFPTVPVHGTSLLTHYGSSVVSLIQIFLVMTPTPMVLVETHEKR